MRSTDIARALFLSLLSLGADAQSKPTCTPKNGNALEKRFCEAIVKQMEAYKPKEVAPNRTLSRSTIEFAAWSDRESVTLASVLVKDPIGKNSMKLIFVPAGDIPTTTRLALEALGKILKVPVTEKNVGWIVQVPTR